jgi:hypothetical protein
MSTRYIRLSVVSLLACSALLVSAAAAQEFRVEPLAEGPPSELAPDIAKLMQPSGFKVMKGEARTVCEIWLCKELAVKPDFSPTPDVIYPLAPGQLVGVARYKNKGGDFRDQDVGTGVYTLRYAQQPVDGSHVGTSPTRDFLLLTSAERDKSPAVVEYKPLVEGSAAAAGSTHPCLLSLQRVQGDAKAPSVQQNEANEWTIVRLSTATKAGDKAGALTFDLVVVGHAAE